jgi:hypothetical protein
MSDRRTSREYLDSARQSLARAKLENQHALLRLLDAVRVDPSLELSARVCQVRNYLRNVGDLAAETQLEGLLRGEPERRARPSRLQLIVSFVGGALLIGAIGVAIARCAQ